MEPKPHRKTREEKPDSFLVTVEREIGRVNVGGSGDHTPVEAAFLLVAQYGDVGTFRFEYGGVKLTVTVDVDTGLQAPEPGREF